MLIKRTTVYFENATMGQDRDITSVNHFEADSMPSDMVNDYTYMFSDCGNTWRHGEKVKRELELRYSSLTETEKDLVGLYHNHILKRCNRGTDYAQFCKQVKNLPDTLEEACKYYQEINPRNI